MYHQQTIIHHRLYFLRMTNTLLVMPQIPPSVIIEGDLMGKVTTLKYLDHEITNAQKFPELSWEKYVCTKILPGTSAILFEP
jgi:hypothetical protein